jgi:hypothetical protein
VARIKEETDKKLKDEKKLSETNASCHQAELLSKIEVGFDSTRISLTTEPNFLMPHTSDIFG